MIPGYSKERNLITWAGTLSTHRLSSKIRGNIVVYEGMGGLILGALFVKRMTEARGRRQRQRCSGHLLLLSNHDFVD